MSRTWKRIRRSVAAFAGASLIAVVGVGAIAPETAQAAGVVVEHRTYGSTTPGVPTRDRDQD